MLSLSKCPITGQKVQTVVNENTGLIEKSVEGKKLTVQFINCGFVKVAVGSVEVTVSNDGDLVQLCANMLSELSAVSLSKFHLEGLRGDIWNVVHHIETYGLREGSAIDEVVDSVNNRYLLSVMCSVFGEKASKFSEIPFMGEPIKPNYSNGRECDHYGLMEGV